MVLLKSSARDKLMKDIFLDKRGAVDSGDSHSSNSNNKRPFIWAAIFFILIVVGVFALGFASSASGQATISNAVSQLKSFTIEPASNFLQQIYGTGAGDFFNYKINDSSTEMGIKFTSFTSIIGNVVPKGQDINLMYGYEFKSLENKKSYPTEFFCDLKVNDGETGEYSIPGTIIPSSTVELTKNSNIMCQISSEDMESLGSDSYNIYGSFAFDFENNEARLPVYYIPETTLNEIGNEDFFDYYNLDVSQSDLRVTYSGEPIGIAIGVGGEGNEEQPIIVRGTDTINTIGITMTNEWQGDITELKYLELLLPEEVTLSDFNEAPTQTCPFIQAGTERGYNIYVLDESVNQELFGKYVNIIPFFGDQNYHTFQCWIDVDQGIFNDAPYVIKDYVVNIEYKYKVKDKVASVTLIEPGESLVK